MRRAKHAIVGTLQTGVSSLGLACSATSKPTATQTQAQVAASTTASDGHDLCQADTGTTAGASSVTDDRGHGRRYRHGHSRLDCGDGCDCSAGYDRSYGSERAYERNRDREPNGAGGAA